MAQAAVSGAVTVAEAIEAYCTHLRESGGRAGSLKSAHQQLVRFFESMLDQPLAVVTPQRATDLYGKLRAESLAVATHQRCLRRARGLFAWCVEQRLVKKNPIASVKPVGMASRGKPQLRIDEAKALVGFCVGRAESGVDVDAAIAVLMAVLFGMRASEIVTRTVRDLDAGGTILWIDDVLDWQTKTRAGRRQIQIPAVMQPLLQRLALGKTLHAPLFEAPMKGGRRHADWVRVSVRRLCKAVGVPIVCAHALRGQHATLAVQAGATPQLVATTLGHESPQITRAAYIAPGTEHAANIRSTTEQLLH